MPDVDTQAKKSFEDAAAILTSTLNLIETTDTPMSVIDHDAHNEFVDALEEEWDDEGGLLPVVEALASLFTYFMLEMADDDGDLVREQIMDISKRCWSVTEDTWDI